MFLPPVFDAEASARQSVELSTAHRGDQWAGKMANRATTLYRNGQAFAHLWVNRTPEYE
jgi:hypothetical protein